MANKFNLTGDAQRNLLVCAVNVGTTDSPEWEIQGRKIEDSTMDISVDEETITDILGDTYTTVNKMETTQGFDPNTLSSGAKLSEQLLDHYRKNETTKFSNYEVLTIYAFIGEEGAYSADLWTNCTIRPTSIGGSSRVGMPFDIAYGGEKKIGTVNKYRGSGILFAENAEVPEL